jgi:hypothetical protein
LVRALWRPVGWFHSATPSRVKWWTPSSAHMARTAGSSPSSSSQTSNVPSYRTARAAASVRRTISIGSLLGTIVVMNAIR